MTKSYYSLLFYSTLYIVEKADLLRSVQGNCSRKLISVAPGFNFLSDMKLSNVSTDDFQDGIYTCHLYYYSGRRNICTDDGGCTIPSYSLVVAITKIDKE
ncbi:hypothetical protein [Dipodfec virus RodF1_11]|uniref:Uncharacterized protein n=1 Tax=Dipodfec virus RodF1_11 TaxID=2929288 RepID=A0A976N399_9VIRU|nr:hypothetical protein [Dipodfec virus RodF1_11]